MNFIRESKEVCLEENQEELMMMRTIKASLLLSDVDHSLKENEVRTYAFRAQEMSLLLSEC